MSMTVIEHIEVTSAVSVMEFTSISGDYTDLLLVFSTRASDTSNEINVRFNSDSSSVYSRRYLRGDGSSAASFGFSTQDRLILSRASVGSGDTANTFSNGSIYIPNYAGSANKSVSLDFVNENNATGADQTILAGLWGDTSAITSISLTEDSANFAVGSSATLYGITAGSDGSTTVS